MSEKRATLLITDDSVANVRVMAAALEDRYNIKVATTGSQCIALASQHMPDLILLDVMLPDVSGFDVCKVLKNMEDTRGIPVIFVTGLTENVNEEEGFSVGAVDYITKLINASILRARTNTHVTLKKQSDQLRELAVKDPLTGLFNRHFLHVIAEKMIARSNRHQNPLTAVMLDIDNFKTINDSLGHIQGDQVIRELAALLKSQFRREDMISRFGGEEFLILMEHCGETEAMFKAERIRRAVAKNGLNGQQVTISLGVAELINNKEALPDLVERADKALYAAKSGGRNKSVTWGSLNQSE